jgi:hypothetical protein
VAYLRKGETYSDLAIGFGIATTVFRIDVRSGILAEAIPEDCRSASAPLR